MGFFRKVVMVAWCTIFLVVAGSELDPTIQKLADITANRPEEDMDSLSEIDIPGFATPGECNLWCSHFVQDVNRDYGYVYGKKLMPKRRGQSYMGIEIPDFITTNREGVVEHPRGQLYNPGGTGVVRPLKYFKSG